MLYLTTISDFQRKNQVIKRMEKITWANPIVKRGTIDALTRDMVDRGNSTYSESDRKSSDSDLDSDYSPTDGRSSQPSSLRFCAVTESEQERTDNSLAESPTVSDHGTDSDSDIVIGGVTVTTYGSVKGRKRIEGTVLQGPM